MIHVEKGSEPMISSNAFLSSNFFSNNFKSNNLYDLSYLYKDYYSIQKGTYKKLLKAYYASQKDTTESSKKKSDTLSNVVNSNTTTDTTLTSVNSKADELVTSSKVLTETGSKSLFTKKQITTKDETTGDINTTYEYNKEAIVKAVKDFASDYNSLLDSTSKTTNATVLQRTVSVVNNTKFYKNSLSDIGVTIGKDNKLTVDEEKLKSADIASVKNLFQGVSSFAYTTSSKASMISSAAKKAATTPGTYGTTGKYNTYNYNSFSTYL